MKRFLCILFFIFYNSCTDFVFVITSYNNRQWYEQNLNSVFSQQYNNYRIVYIDDCSTDGTADLVRLYIDKNNVQNRMQLICNKTRKFKLQNLYEVIHSFSNDKEVVIELDGDDFLAHPWVLNRLSDVYADNNIWFTYGQFINLSDGVVCSWNQDMPAETVKNHSFRVYSHLPSHLRTFYVKLFKNIKIQDLKLEDDFFTMTSDVAIALPMIEMAAEHFKFISEPILIYNDLNDINDHKVDGSKQFRIRNIIRKKHPYRLLNTLF